MAHKKKRQGHYCHVCGRYRANEKISGKGHARHICKDCTREQKAAASQQRRERLQKNKRLKPMSKKLMCLRSPSNWWNNSASSLMTHQA